MTIRDLLAIPDLAYVVALVGFLTAWNPRAAAFGVGLVALIVWILQ